MKETRLKNTSFFLKIGFSSREGKRRSCEEGQKMRLPSLPSLLYSAFTLPLGLSLDHISALSLSTEKYGLFRTLDRMSTRINF